MAKKASKNSNRNRWLLIIAAFILLFLFLFNAVPRQTYAPTQTTQKNSVPADWQTFKGNGYSFKYPSSFSSNPFQWGALLNKGDEELTVGVNGGITLPEIAPSKTEDVQFAGQNAHKETFTTDAGDVSGVYYLFNKDESAYIVGYSLKGDFFHTAIPKEDLKTLDQILSTFKFE